MTIGNRLLFLVLIGSWVASPAAQEPMRVSGHPTTITSGITFLGDLVVADGAGVIIGNGTQITAGALSELQLLGTAEADSSAIFGQWAADANPAYLAFVKSRNAAIGSFTIVADNDAVGGLRFYPDDGVDYETRAAQFTAEVDDASPSAGDVGMAFVWDSMAGGGAALAERMRLTSTGFLGINTTTPDGSLHVHPETAGIVTANSNGDDLVVEIGGPGGISILTPDASPSNLFFGSPGGNAGLLVQWDRDAGVAKLETNKPDAMITFRTGSQVEAVRIDGNQNVGIGTTVPTRIVDVAGFINASGISVSESYKSGLGVSIGTDTSHDINVAAGGAQSRDTSENIIFAAQAGKQLDVKWATGAAAGMLGDPDRTSAIVLTFTEDGGGGGVDTVTAGSGTPWAACNALTTETGTVIFQGGSTNNGTFEITSCTDTVLTLGDVLTTETSTSGEYESRLVLPTTWYHVYLIESAGAEDICADVSELAANCLSESTYDEYRLLQSILTNATANIQNF